jgi:hypothetical protein
MATDRKYAHIALMEIGEPQKSLQAAERQLERLTAELGPDHAQTRLARSSLAILFRNAGQPQRADALFPQTQLCPHLQPVLEYIRSQGVHIFDVCTPWSRNCRNWVYFENIVLDADALKLRFSHPDCVVVHSHRGTHEGSEHGLVCQLDHDALMGSHPEVAPSSRIIR